MIKIKGVNLMIVIYAEKEDMGKKIAAALDAIHLDNGNNISFNDMSKNDKAISVQARKDGFFKIAYNGEETYVTWGWGHLCGLKQAADYNPAYKNWSSLPVPFIPNKYELKVIDAGSFTARNTKQLSVIKRLFDNADLIINSTDADREGEVIFAYVYEYLKCTKPFKRALFSEQTQSGIKDAFTRLVDSSERLNIEKAGRARNIADSIVGWNLTAQLTLHNKSKEVLSVGRVQTATLNMVVKKELAIRNFKPEDYFTLEADFTTKSGETYKGIHQTKKFTNKTDAENIFNQVNGNQGVITFLNKENGMLPVPELFNQDVLQMECNDKFGLKSKDTLNIAQFLYNNGYTTYPRTSSRYLTEDMKGKVDYVLDQLETLPEYKGLIQGRPRNFFTKRFFDNKKVKSHFAIIPTGVIPTGLNQIQQKVYDLICRSVIRMLYPPVLVENTKVVTTVNSNNFLSTGKVIKDPGWSVVTGIPKVTTLPSLSMNEVVDGKYNIESKQTKPPQRYTDKTLIKAMVTAGKEISDKELREILSDPQDGGIGTTATRAEIIEILVNRGYIERQGKVFFATDKGIELIEKLPVEDIKSAEITAIWEKRLTEIQDGNDTIEHFLDDIYVSVNKWCGEINHSTIIASASPSNVSNLKCPLCSNNLVKTNWGWGCSGYKAGCKFSIGKICGKSLSDAQVKNLIEKKRTSEIKGFKSKKGKPFSAILTLDASGNIKFEFPKTPKKST